MEITIKITAHEEGYTARVIAADILLDEFRGAEGYGSSVEQAIRKMTNNTTRYESASSWDIKLSKWNKNVADWARPTIL